MNTKKLQSCLNCFSVIKFVKGLQITIMDNPRSDELIQKSKVLLPTLKCLLKGQMKEILPQWLLQTMHVALVPSLLYSNR